MLAYKIDLDFDRKEYNYIADLTELIINGERIPITMKIDNENDLTELNSTITYRFREEKEYVNLSIIFNESKLKSIEVSINDIQNQYNEYDLKYFYYDVIQNQLFINRNSSKKKFTIRNYRSIFNSHTIQGAYQINIKNKFRFFPLFNIERKEPMTEHIIVFDIEVEESNIDRARSKAHNLVSDYTAFLSVLLDVGLEDINSKYVHYIKSDAFGNIMTERYRTGFGDNELNLFVKDNLNGLVHRKDMNKESLIGYISYSSMDEMKQIITEKVGNTPELDSALSKHRIYKTKEQNKGTPQYREDIKESLHFINEPILIPRLIRQYFKSIERLEESEYTRYIYFRNACRLYNLSHSLGHKSPTSQLSYLVSAIEVLAKSEASNFTQFNKKYNQEADSKLLDFMYGKIRSGHFHSGEFLFHEFNVELNSSANSKFFIARNDLINARNQLRKTFVAWINSELLNIKKHDCSDE